MQRFGVDDRGASDAEQNNRTAQVPGEGQNHKKLEDLDPEPWLSPGHPPRDDELMQIPPGAYRSDKLRVRAFLGLDARGNQIQEGKKVMDESGFASLLIENYLRTRQALFAWIMRGKRGVARKQR